MSIDRALAIVADRGRGLRADDVREISDQLLLAPADEAHNAAPWIWESVERIVNDPEYTGDAKVPSDSGT